MISNIGTLSTPFSSTPSGLYILQIQKPKSARYCAAKILSSLVKNQTPVKPVFDRVVTQFKLPSNERNLTMQLVYGVLRKRQFLDRVLTLLSRTPIRKMDLFIHQALAVGLYQIFFLDRIPDSAAVNEAVESCKVAKIHKRLHGFVNGILRQAIRTKDELKKKARTDKQGQEILNHPEWLTHRWEANFGKEATIAMCQNNNNEPILSLRVNTTRVDQKDFLALLEKAELKAQPGLYTKDAVVLPEYSGAITELPGFAQGFFQVQDEAAQLATTLLAPFVAEGNYLDGCAGLGGKTSHLLQEAASLGIHVHAVEPESFRLQKLQENMDRLFTSPPLTVHKSSLLDITEKTVPLFDGILIDAPCSGTGVIGRHPDIRWNRTVDDLQYYHDEQLALLTHAATLLKNGGILVYATCSLEPEEDSDVVQAFLKTNQHFELTDCSEVLPETAHKFIRNGFFHPLPAASIDGFFAARLRKKRE